MADNPSDQDLSDKPSLSGAFISYYRQWLAFDGVWLRFVEEHGLTECAFRIIVKEYGIDRCLQKYKTYEGRQSQLLLIKEFGVLSLKWQDELGQRAQQCIELAKSGKCYFNRRKKTGEIFAGSLVSKVMWFLKPDNWTVFDSLASDGMGCKKSDTQERMEEFYDLLGEIKFVSLATSMQTLIGDSPFNELHGSRVIDMWLMLNGGLKTREMSNQENKHFLSLLNETQRNDIVELGQKLENRFGSHDLFQVEARKPRTGSSNQRTRSVLAPA